MKTARQFSGSCSWRFFPVILRKRYKVDPFKSFLAFVIPLHRVHFWGVWAINRISIFVCFVLSELYGSILPPPQVFFALKFYFENLKHTPVDIHKRCQPPRSRTVSSRFKYLLLFSFDKRCQHLLNPTQARFDFPFIVPSPKERLDH